ncbi:helix-turn-helix domain-containing protein, partial [Acidaminococcus fermentans]|uniref:helix-turn-helix domain-containing protein n=1 Tax=Acidaminococcus fermentans TaxID=905 RepID=UPI00266BAC95
MSFQEKLRYYREKAGYKSAKEFANLLDVPYTTYVAYENKGREPRYDTLKKISFLLEVSIDTLLENEATEIQKAIQDLRTCGFIVTRDHVIEKFTGYHVEWGKVVGTKLKFYEHDVVLASSELVALYASVQEERKEIKSLLNKIKTISYEKRLTEIHLKKIEETRKYLFINAP